MSLPLTADQNSRLLRSLSFCRWGRDSHLSVESRGSLGTLENSRYKRISKTKLPDEKGSSGASWELWGMPSDDLAKLQLCGDTVSRGTVWPRVLAWTSQALGMEAASLAVIRLDISFVSYPSVPSVPDPCQVFKCVILFKVTATLEVALFCG